MNKKIVATLLPILVFTGVGLGALVNYLSNTIYLQNVQINSPIELQGTISGSTTVYGGDTQQYTYNAVNHANNDISGKFKLVIHEPDTANLKDLTSYSLTVDGNLISLTASVKGNDYILESDSATIPAGQTVSVVWNVTFAPNIEPGNYSFETIVLPIGE